ncbi:hypothetical protein PCP35_09245 [Pseudomonas aeruginosa]|uniref:hypothetical protein n=1 Tax=Pseudomonas aeruginosa TaxID=287 RepID=UPI002E32E9B7|nr:hypothetical protein [Pseudomonas aeruginosa]
MIINMEGSFDIPADYFERMPEDVTQAVRMAINDVAKGPALRRAREEVGDQVNFPAGYLTGDRLGVSKLARNHDLEAVITGRDRPTSLARFVRNPRPGQRGVMVEVHKGSAQYMKKAFLLRLRSGRVMDGQTFNIGLAIRLAPGEKIHNRREAANVNYSSLGNGVVLLYGPSVDQVFRSVSDDIAPEVGDMAVAEFWRQFARLTNG